MKKLIPLLAVITMLLFFGCAGVDNNEEGMKNSQDGAHIDTAKETVQQKEENVGEQEELVLSFVGDMMFDRSVAGYIRSKGCDYIFQGYEEHFKNSDIVFGNLETALSHHGEPSKDKEYTFRSSPDIAPFLKKYNFNALSIANNHSLDYGPAAFADAMKILRDNEISYGGGGHNRQQAMEGVVIDKKGVKIGFIAFTRVTPSVDWYAGAKKPGIIGAYKIHEESVLEAVKSLNDRCDLMVVSLHWGKEVSTVIRREEMELSHKLVDSGADVIMGHHPHVVQGIEMYNNKPIFYSLGNFIFTTSRAEICNNTIMATVRYEVGGELKSVEAIPGIIKHGRPVPMEEVRKSEFIEQLNKMNINIEL